MERQSDTMEGVQHLGIKSYLGEEHKFGKCLQMGNQSLCQSACALRMSPISPHQCL